jgi:hypothetical protein
MAEKEKSKRSVEEEQALDRKIAEIRRKNQLIEERRKIVEVEAQQNNVPKPIQTANTVAPNKSSSPTARQAEDQTLKPANVKPRGNNRRPPKADDKWDREWDAGKVPAEKWKMNVPELGDQRRPFPNGTNGNAVRPNNTRNALIGTSRGGQRTSRGAPPQRPIGSNGTAQRPLRPPANNIQSRVERNGSKTESPTAAQKRNPGFFHDDRLDENENGTENGKAAKAPNKNGVLARVQGKNIASRITVGGGNDNPRDTQNVRNGNAPYKNRSGGRRFPPTPRKDDKNGVKPAEAGIDGADANKTRAKRMPPRKPQQPQRFGLRNRNGAARPPGRNANDSDRYVIKRLLRTVVDKVCETEDGKSRESVETEPTGEKKEPEESNAQVEGESAEKKGETVEKEGETVEKESEATVTEVKTQEDITAP